MSEAPRKVAVADNVRIVPPTASHIPAIRRLELEAGVRFAEIGLTSIAESEPPSADELSATIAAGRLLLAVDDGDGDPVGYIQWSIVDGTTHIDQVSVHPRAAGRAIGRMLINRVCDGARSRGDDKVTLTTFTTIAWNGPLYERYGFEIVGDNQLAPELSGIRLQERSDGLDVLPRAAMYRSLDANDPNTSTRRER